MSLGDKWIEVEEQQAPPKAINVRQHEPSDIELMKKNLDRVIMVAVQNPEPAIRTLASSVATLAMLTMDQRKARQQVTYNAFRRLLRPAYEYVFTLVKKYDPNLWDKPEAGPKHLHSLSVDFHPTQAFIGVRVTYRDIDYIRTYSFRLEPASKAHLEKIPQLAQMDDRPHQKLLPIL